MKNMNSFNWYPFIYVFIVAKWTDIEIQIIANVS